MEQIWTLLYFRVPWLIPILKADEVADDIVDAVREEQEMLVLPKFLGKLLAIKRWVLFPRPLLFFFQVI